jgi:hypothetical protein
MLCRPAVRLEVAHSAVALLTATGWATHEPIVCPPSLKFTVPVGLAPVMDAVNVTDWPTLDGLWDELSVVVVAGLAAPAVIVTEAGSAVSLVIVAPCGP